MGKAANRLVLCLIFLFVIIFLAASAYNVYKKEYINNPSIKDNLKPFNTNHIYNFYVKNLPDISNRNYYGSPNASVTIIAFLDTDSESSKYFMGSIFPKIDEEFIRTGKIRFYGKNYLTTQDFAQKSNKFLYAAYLMCIKSIKEEKYYPFYFDMFKLKEIGQISGLLAKYNLSKAMMDNCLQGKNFNEMNMDILEVENFGTAGISPRFYIGIGGIDNVILDGVPDYSKFNRTIRQQEFSIGT